MATITQEVTTTESVEYETPFYRKIGTSTFIKVYDATKMLIVNTTSGFPSVKAEQFPGSSLRDIAVDSEASDETEFEAAATSALDAIDLIITPA